ncbi:M56 family metallopeptidase [uncultured Dysosmobacter sp.]|uniref:M56 family metallopeptidase n=1 Tax=uncultured Dysosmobacter sp. TaxID=2591384 RepID=UPI002672E91C|nr:M56 family metallopeptidase [uncultured Dysosmobacter sp.]
MGEFVMHRLFPIVCNMSLTASVVILAVLAVRLLLRRAPKVFAYALWAVVLFRLLCPVSVTSAVSLLGALGAPAQERTQRTSAVEYVPADIMIRGTAPAVTQLPQPPLPAETGENIVSTAPSVTPPDAAPVSPLSGPVAVLTLMWLAGMVLLLAYSLVSLLRLRRRLVGTVRLRDNIYLADHIPSPFVMGLFRPKIYLPSTLTETERGYILRHEQYHLRRRDHLVKFLSFLALCIHWFNPLVWAAFVLSGKDMEMSCDEAVVRELGEDIRADYSASLLSLATGRRIVAGMPLAFGEGDTGSRIRNLLNWKRPRPWVMAVCAVVCVGLIALCAANPGGTDAADGEENGSWPSVEAYVQDVMLSQTEVSYYAYNADGTISSQPRTAAVTDRKLIYLEKGGEVTGLAPDGILEEWEYHYLTKPELDVDMDAVALAGGQYHDDEGYFDLGSGNRHIVVALRHEDNRYDILCDIPTNDGIFSGYHNTMEEAIYDWYVTDQNLDLSLYVEDWIDQINYNNPNDKPGNYPVHRYDVDGGYLYIPISAWIMADVTAHRSHGHWEWYSGYDTGSILTVDRFTQTLEDEYITSRKQGFEPLDDSKQIWKRRQDGINERYYFYPAADGNGCWRVWTLWTDLGISDYPYIFIEPQVMYLMAESFTPVEDFTPAAGNSTRTERTSTQIVPVGKSSAEITVGYTTQQGPDGEVIDPSAGIFLKNVAKVNNISRVGAVEQDQIVYLNDGKTAIVPVSFTAGLNEGGEGVRTYGTVVTVDLTGGGVERSVLSQQELDAYNAVMDPAVRDESGDIVDLNIQPASYFLTSYYDNVRDLNFEEFIRYFPSSGKTTEAEFEALKKLDDWPFKWVENMADMPVPIQQHTVSSINEVLTRWGGITTNDLDTAGVCYLEKYDAYYTYTSDFNTVLFAAESGQQVENYVYLYGNLNDSNCSVLTLRLTPGTDGWQFVSYLPLVSGN